MEYVLSKAVPRQSCGTIVRRKHLRGQPGATEQPMARLMQLPPELLVLIDQHAQEDDEHPLLPVCRTARDSVLQMAKEVTLVLPPPDDSFSLPATAQLLDRACSLAPQGVQLNLHGTSTNFMAFHALLQTGAGTGGWRNVYTLFLQVGNSLCIASVPLPKLLGCCLCQY
jgi:hypothetical protein